MILLFGPTGAGKSMQGQMLAVRQGWKWLSTGEMLRASDDPKVIAVLKSGELVSDELTYDVFDKAVQDAKAKHFKNIIVDGFPQHGLAVAVAFGQCRPHLRLVLAGRAGNGR